MRRPLASLLIAAVLAGPARADDASEITRLVQGKTTGFKVSGGWALANWVDHEAGGQTLLRKYDGKWHLVTGGGGAMDAAYLWEFGVPEAVIPRLLSSMEGMGEGLAKAKSEGPYWSWLTSDRTIKDDDLDGKSAWELILMRNEVFARHGRPFKDPLLKAYFESRPWYHANSGYSDALLTERERRNAGFIQQYQQRKHLQD